MSNFAWIIFLVLILTLLGSFILIFITVKFYWGERGKPPLTGASRHQQKEEELLLRAKQFELSKKYPRELRHPNFWKTEKRTSGK